MKIDYSADLESDRLYSTVTFWANDEDYGHQVEVGVFIPNSDSRSECVKSTRQEAERMLERALSALRAQGQQ